VTRPLDRTGQLPQLGALDEEAGEFWVANPFTMPAERKNLSAFERNRLYLNVPDGPFLDASFASTADIDSDSRSVVAADFNRDGAVDLLICSVGGGPLRLFLNRFPRRHWIRLDLVGKASNRPAIGSRVILHCEGRQIVRDLFAPNPFMGQGPPQLLIGVGTAEQIERIEIRWPNGGIQEYQQLPVDRHITIRESETGFEVQKLSPSARTTESSSLRVTIPRPLTTVLAVPARSEHRPSPRGITASPGPRVR